MSLRLTTLEAVNQMLSCIGGQAVVSLDNDNPEVASAVAILEETTRGILAEGWNFNSEKEYPFTPDSNKHIRIPENVVSFSLSFSKHYSDAQIVERQGKLYDKLNHTFEFEETLYFDVVWMFKFEECPMPFREYIASRAGRIYASRLVASREQVELISQDEAANRAICIAYDTETSKPTMFGLQNGQQTYISYMPYNTLTR